MRMIRVESVVAEDSYVSLCLTQHPYDARTCVPDATGLRT